MSDIDIWVPFEKWNILVERLRKRGYTVIPSPTTPPALLQRFGGELKFAPPQDHFAVNHRLGHFGLRGVLDVHVLAKHAHLNWEQIVQDASAWHLRTLLWVVLTLTRHFFDTPVPSSVLDCLQPGRWRRQVLQALRLERAVYEPTTYPPFLRFLLLYLLVDEPRAAIRFLRHTLWPEGAVSGGHG